MTAKTNTAIHVDNVVKEYGQGASAVTALRHVSLDIQDNEFFTLLGPSGCGKTTLLRCLAGFENVSGGNILLFGDEIADLPPEERPINTVFQNYSLFPHMSVLENVAFGLRRKGTGKADALKRAQEMLDLVHLGDFSKRKPDQLSGGQQQRVALARALAPHPHVLLLDEPLSALDLKLRQSMRSELKRLQRETGITFVFVTHDQEEALAMSDRIAVISAGELQQVAPPSEIYEHPANRFVADFIGDANLFDAQATDQKGALCSFDLGGGLHLQAPTERAFATGEKVTLMLRPEKVAMQAGHDGKGLEGKIEDAVYLGVTTEYHVALPNGLNMTLRAENGSDGANIAQIGDDVRLEVDPDAIRILTS